MYRNFPTPTPRFFDCEPRIIQPTLIKEFIPAVGRVHHASLNSHAKGRPNGVHSLLRSGWAFFHCVGPVCYVFSVWIYTFHMVIMNTLALSVDIS